MKTKTTAVMSAETAIAAANEKLSLEIRIPIIYLLEDPELLKKIVITSKIIEVKRAALTRMIFLKLEQKLVTNNDLLEVAKKESNVNFLSEILMFIDNKDALNEIQDVLHCHSIISSYCSDIISLRERDLFFMKPFMPSRKDEEEQLSAITYLNLPSSILEYAYISKSEKVKNVAVELIFSIENRNKDLQGLLPVNFNRDFMQIMAENLLQTSFRGEAIIFTNSYIDSHILMDTIENEDEKEDIKLYLLDKVPELSQDFLRNIALTSDQDKVRRRIGQMLKKKEDVFEILDKETSFLNQLLFSFMLRFKTYNA